MTKLSEYLHTAEAAEYPGVHHKTEPPGTDPDFMGPSGIIVGRDPIHRSKTTLLSLPPSSNRCTAESECSHDSK